MDLNQEISDVKKTLKDTPNRLVKYGIVLVVLVIIAFLIGSGAFQIIGLIIGFFAGAQILKHVGLKNQLKELLKEKKDIENGTIPDRKIRETEFQKKDTMNFKFFVRGILIFIAFVIFAYVIKVVFFG